MSSPFASAPLNRRQFLRRMGIATGGVMSLSLLRSLDAFGATEKPLKVVIIGAGLKRVKRARKVASYRSGAFSKSARFQLPSVAAAS